ncbi:MAG: Gfo/Idh/MocA family oxidoreductase [Eubacteriales bacterium]|nr:Gfo/Idh/MocA family oxidoreductase [Eubacteriales bacterium]
MKDIRTAVIGTGLIANSAHLAAIQRIGSGFDVVACYDMRVSAAKETAERFNIPNVYEDVDKMLEEMKPELVIVATSNASHKEMSLKALKRGANVVCEKPVAMKYADAVELFDEAEKRGLHFFPAQTERFRQERLAARKLVKTGELGEVYFAEFESVRRRGIPQWGFFHMKEYNVGGPFADLGVHEIDHMLYTLGNPKPITVSGSTWSKIGNSGNELEISAEQSGALGGIEITPRPYDWKEFSVEDMATGIIRLEGDLTINFKCSWALNVPDRFTRTYAGTKAGMRYGNDHPMTIYSDVAGWQSDKVPYVYGDADYPSDLPFPGHVGLLKNVYGVLRNGEEPIVKKEETLNVTTVIEAFYKSAELHKEINCLKLRGEE